MLIIETVINAAFTWRLNCTFVSSLACTTTNFQCYSLTDKNVGFCVHDVSRLFSGIQYVVRS